MDGLLIDSEPHWRQAEDDVLGGLGLALTDRMKFETTGMRLKEALAIWRSWFPEADLDTRRIGESLTALMVERMTIAEAKSGAVEAIRICREAGCRMAVASSSPSSVIAAGLLRLGVEEYFQAVISAEGEERGKPHPDVYLSAARALGIQPAHCIAFEDSLHGLRSAHAAGMHCVAVPEEHNRKNPGFAIAHRVLASLADFRPEFLNR